MGETTQSKTVAVIVITALVTALSFNLIISNQTSALSLGDVTNFFDNILGRDKPAIKKTSNPKPTVTSDTKPASNQPSSNTSDSDKTGGYKGEPLTQVNPINLDELTVNYSNLAAVEVPTSTNSMAIHNPAKTTSNMVPLKASSQGWEIFGLPWYMWLVGIGIATTSAVYVLRIARSIKRNVYWVK
ncbi:MAG TPA: hypothetical protein PK543_00660 [Candidatus Saccharibacteria bacterium]|nr:hypothetical protein [Candidatus Saccharibacteria bacterium]